MKLTKLVMGGLSILIAIPLLIQTQLVKLKILPIEAFDISKTMGVLLALIMIITGFITIFTRTHQQADLLIAAPYIIFGFICLPFSGHFLALQKWAIFSIIFGLIFMALQALLIKKQIEKRKKIRQKRRGTSKKKH